nr:zf-CCHC domain-containing protein/DUF4219 domain-containing protein/UBN2 domain-containing protein [Tanacetum cinerariifolium]
MSIKEAKDLATLSLDELIENPKDYEMVLDNDGLGSKTTKEKVKSLALKANITRGQTSNNSTCQDKSDEDEEINLMAKNFKKLSQKGVKKAYFETYVKSKDIDLWQVIQNGDCYYEVEDSKTKLMKETPYELLEYDQKKKLGRNNETKMTLYNALPRKKYERVFMCKTAKEIWHTLI